MAQLWGGRFTKETDQLVYNFNASISFDKRFYAQDIRGSIAHVMMLARQGILTELEKEKIIEGLEGILSDVESGKLEIMKSGLSNTHMIFEKDKINITQYETPYGELLVGTHTKDMQVDVTDSSIDVHVNYALDVNSETIADCNIDMNIKALDR